MSGATARVSDATGNWVDTRAPPWSRPWLRLSRLDRPIGSWLLLMPCWWSAALAAGIAHDLRPLPLILVLFFVGAFAMRGAGCTWNDITDRDLDALVERTRSRPIPAGDVSVAQASGTDGVLRPCGGADCRGAVAGRRGLAGMDRACSVCGASLPANRKSRDRRSRALPAAVQIQPRCRIVAVCRIAGRCNAAGDG